MDILNEYLRQKLKENVSTDLLRTVWTATLRVASEIADIIILKLI